MIRWGILAALLSTACRPGGSFVCELDDECTGGVEGRCEPSGFCSFADPSCPSGRRYGEHAADDLADACAADTPDNLLANPGFEQGLAGWVALDGTLEDSDIARSGERSARLCAADAETGYALGDSPDSVAAPAPGELYRARAWVRAAPGEPAPLVTLILREPPPEAGVETRSSALALDESWRAVEIEHRIDTASSLAVLVRGLEGQQSCFLIDDLELVRLE